MRSDYAYRKNKIAYAFRVQPDALLGLLISWYEKENLSAQQIADRILDVANERITARSVQRLLKSAGKTRGVGDAFRLAISQGRINWAYKDPLMKVRRKRLKTSLRYAILKRDGFRCVLCGTTAKESLLEIDHITPLARGGETKEENLRTLCKGCNEGKRIIEKEV